MKEIIKEGKIKLKTFNCLNCGCKFKSDEYKGEFTSNKVKVEINDACPTCNNICHLKDKI